MIFTHFTGRPALTIRLIGLALVSWSVLRANHHAPGGSGRGLLISVLFALCVVAWLAWMRRPVPNRGITPEVWVLAAAGGVLCGASPSSAASAFVFVAVVAAGVRAELSRAFAGLSSSDSNTLFELLQRHVIRLENTVRWNWHPGDIAIWDNRATQHYAVSDYDARRRRSGRIPPALARTPRLRSTYSSTSRLWRFAVSLLKPSATHLSRARSPSSSSSRSVLEGKPPAARARTAANERTRKSCNTEIASQRS